MAKATSGWMPTMTVSAPRSRVMCAMPRSERDPKASMTIPRERYRPTWPMMSSCRRRTSVSVSAAWIDAMRNGPCLRIGTATRACLPRLARHRELGGGAAHLVAEQPLRLLDAALQVADRVHLGQVHTDRHERLGDLRRQAGDDDAGAHEAGGLDGLDEVVGDGRVDGRHAGDVDHHDL